MNNFVVEIWKKFNFGYRYLNSYKLSVFFKPNKVLTYTVKKTVELLDAPSKNTFLIPNKYNSKVKIIYLDTHVFFPPLCYRMRKFDIREVQTPK
jgi:hypothetical protein